MRRRPQLTVGNVMEFLSKLDPKTKVFIAPSILNLDEPTRTQEFIDHDRKIKCVAVETNFKTVTFGYPEK